ncbi:MAG: replication initiator protein A [Geobacter sp.]
MSNTKKTYQSSNLLKIDIASMKYPFFSLTGGEERREYVDEGRGVSVLITTDKAIGAPSVMDRDVLTYCQSILRQRYNRTKLTDLDESPSIDFTFRAFCTATGRAVGGSTIAALEKSLQRLQAVCITTKGITVDGLELAEHPVHIIDEYSIPERIGRQRGRSNDLTITIKPARWVYKSLIRDYLIVDPSYYRLRSPLARRLFEIGRAFVGDRPGDFPFEIGRLSQLLDAKSPRHKLLASIRQHIPALARLGIKLQIKAGHAIYAKMRAEVEPEGLAPQAPPQSEYLQPLTGAEEAALLLQELQAGNPGCCPALNKSATKYDKIQARLDAIFGDGYDPDQDDDPDNALHKYVFGDGP